MIANDGRSGTIDVVVNRDDVVVIASLIDNFNIDIVIDDDDDDDGVVLMDGLTCCFC